jgi:hypothetical protein
MATAVTAILADNHIGEIKEIHSSVGQSVIFFSLKNLLLFHQRAKIFFKFFDSHHGTI